MSRDIRSFFVSKKVAKPAEDDEDVIPGSPDVQIKNKKKETRKRRVLQDDSDEEIFPSKKKASSNEKNKLLSSKKKQKSPQKSSLKEVKTADLFGGPIKRSEPLVTKAKKKNTEVGIHSDDEFDKSLLELDITNDVEKCELQNNDSIINIDKSVIREKAESKESPKQHSVINTSFAENNNGNSESKIDKSAAEHADIYNEIDTSKSKIMNHEHNYKIMKKVNIDTRNNTEINHISQIIKNTSGEKVISNKSYENKIKIEKIEIEKDTQNDRNNEKKSKSSEDDHKDIKKHVSKDETDRKRDFSEFISDHEIHKNTHEPKTKKRKQNTSLNESVLTDEERHERRLQSAALYQKYLNRSGPKHLGSKEIPEGSPNCLKDCAFLLTGVLDSFEREEIADVITKYGGCVKNSISKKVTHVLAGEEAGPAKLAKAQDMGIKIINEDEFLIMIKNSSEKTHNHNLDVKKEIKSNKKSVESRNNMKHENVKNKNGKRVKSNDRESITEENSREVKNKKFDSDMKGRTPSSSKDKESEKKISPKDKVKIERKSNSEPIIQSFRNEGRQFKDNMKGKEQSPVKSETSSSLMWVDKYKPQNLKQIIGQHGDASNVKKLSNWLTKWYVNRKAKLPKPNPWAKNDDGGYYKAALLSGPPGVGKTTTVSLVCKELGFDMVEFNASDTRSKTLIKQQVGELLTTTSLSAYAKGDTGKQAVSKKHVLVMDEVDGMAGNEDRGGLQELIALIKTTSVPIVCMCNDRNSPKMRSLVNYCYDLRFSRPRVDQIKSAMMSICFKEGVKIPPETLSQLIAAAGQDVRQTLHALSMWAADAHRGRAADRGRKDVKMGPWEAIRKVFSAEEHKTMSLNDKSDLFFCDYSLAPLFVQENYLSVVPHCNKKEVLDRISKAADSISIGNLVDARIRGNQAWSLLPLQAMYSSVIPGHYLSGHVAGQIQFPGWLGKNSRANKMHRLCQEIHAHTRLSTSGSKSSIYLDYAAHLRDAVLNPLIKDKADGIPRSLEVLESYHLLREDLDSLTELSLWPGQRNPNVLVDAKVKAAMTRTYNKQASALPYAPGAVRKVRARDANDDYDGDDDQEDYDDDQDNDDPENDALIKKKTSKSAEKTGSSRDKAGSSKERKKKK